LPHAGAVPEDEPGLGQEATDDRARRVKHHVPSLAMVGPRRGRRGWCGGWTTARKVAPGP
jgi:hypothetical protein